jgi:hypothetical protein
MEVRIPSFMMISIPKERDYFFADSAISSAVGTLAGSTLERVGFVRLAVKGNPVLTHDII